jgi:hypothetical protein
MKGTRRFLELLLLLFIGLKLAGYITWSWWLVTLPVTVPVAIAGVLGAVWGVSWLTLTPEQEPGFG